MMSPKIHDNLVYAQAVDFGHRVILHTCDYPYDKPTEFTDVVFDGVATYHFDTPLFASNILFGVDEEDAHFVLKNYTDLFARTKDYGWPGPEYDGIDDLIAKLSAIGARCYSMSASLGLCGFVFAKAMELRSRNTRAEVTTISESV